MDLIGSATLVEKLRAAHRRRDYGALADAIPYFSLLGIELEREPRARLILRMGYRPSLRGAGALHGGALAGLLESSAFLEVLMRGASDQWPRLITFSAQYLRAGKLQDTFAEATINRHGRRVASVQAQAWQEDRQLLVATGQATFSWDHPATAAASGGS
jgi:acyl-coenzyme A thioesterase PaaI-like protein